MTFTSSTLKACSISIPCLRPELLSNQSATMCHTVYVRFADSKFQIMLHPKIAWICLLRLLLEDLQGLVNGTPHQPERWNGSWRSQCHNCEINCNFKVGFNWNDRSNFQVSDVEFAHLWFVGSLGWQKSTAQRLTCNMTLTQNLPPSLNSAAIYNITFLGHRPK